MAPRLPCLLLGRKGQRSPSRAGGGKPPLALLVPLLGAKRRPERTPVGGNRDAACAAGCSRQRHACPAAGFFMPGLPEGATLAGGDGYVQPSPGRGPGPKAGLARALHFRWFPDGRPSKSCAVLVGP